MKEKTGRGWKLRIENQSGMRENCIAAGDFELEEYKEYKEQERKNIEVAVELDRPELYERYLFHEIPRFYGLVLEREWG